LTTESSRSSVSGDQILEQLFELPKWVEKPGTEEFNVKYLQLLTDLSVLVAVRKNQIPTRPKVFVARYPDSIHIESDSAVDVILATIGYGTAGPVLQCDTLAPIPADEFHRMIHDELASEMQAGRVTPMEINNTLVR